MSGNKRVVKFRRRRGINIGIIVFSIMFIYVAINVYLYLTKEHLSIYEVREGTTAKDDVFTGLILRDETVIYSDKAGYIYYFRKEGSRVSKNSSVYAIDDNQQILEIITSGDNPMEIPEDKIAEIKYEIQYFQKTLTDDNFSLVYDFKEDAHSMVLNLLNESMIHQGTQIQENTGYSFNYEIYHSPSSGIVSYYIDSFEDISLDNIRPELFDQESYERTSLRTLDMITKGSPVHKLINSDLWSIVVPISAEQYAKLNDQSKISFTVLKDDFHSTAKLTLLNQGSDYYAVLSMDKHLGKYLNDRFLELKLDFDNVKGLKIPVSSIVDKEFYLVPLEYFTKGANSDSKGLTREIIDKDIISYQFIQTDIYYQDDAYAYVDANQFSLGDVILKPESTEEYRLTKMGTLTGVYNVNKGYAVFKRIEILYQNDEYCIVNKNTSGGLSVYDHIALDGSTVVEQKIIY